MSEKRRLWIRFRAVGEEARDAYREAARAAGGTARELGAHFWVFAIDGRTGRYVEFLEGASDATLARLDEAIAGPLRKAAGADPAGFHVGAEGVCSTEFGHAP